MRHSAATAGETQKDAGGSAANSVFSGTVEIHHPGVVMIAQAIGDPLAERFRDAGGDDASARRRGGPGRG